MIKQFNDYYKPTCRWDITGKDKFMSFFVEEPLNEAGMIATCAWCGGPVVGKGQGRIWLGSRRTYCCPKCQFEAEKAEKNK